MELDLGPHDGFFRSTPRLMATLIEGKRRAADAAHADRAWLAWTIAALGRAKKMPTLDEMTKPARRAPKRRAMSGDQLLTMARMWSAVAGPERREVADE